MKRNNALSWNHIVCPPIALLSLSFASVGHAQSKPDELKQRILAQAQGLNPNDYSFSRTIRSQQSSGGKTEQKVTIEKYDPTKPAGQQWTLVSANGAPPPAEVLNEYNKDSAKRRVPGYHRLAGYFGTTATTSTDSRGHTVFRFATLPKDSVRVLDTDVSQNTTAEATVSDGNGTAFVEQIRFVVKPMRLKLIAKLEQYESTAHYRMGPEGKPLLMEQTSDMIGSGLGKEGRAHTVITYSDYRPIPR